MADTRASYPRGLFGARGPDGKPLPPGARLILALLWSFARWWDADGRDPAALWVYPTAESLARISAMSERSVWRHIATLVEAGAVIRETRYTSQGFKRDGYRLKLYPDTAKIGQVDDELEQADPDSADTPTLTELTGTEQAHPDSSVTPTLTELTAATDRAVTPTLTELTGRRTKEEPTEEPTKTKSAGGMPPGYVDAVCVLLGDAMRDVAGSTKRNPDPASKANRDMISKVWRREQATLDDWRDVIAAQAESVRHDRKAWRFLCLSTIHRPANWARLRDAIGTCATAPRHAKHAPARFVPRTPVAATQFEAELDFDDDPDDLPI